jgi:hypothetical protein
MSMESHDETYDEIVRLMNGVLGQLRASIAPQKLTLTDVSSVIGHIMMDVSETKTSADGLRGWGLMLRRFYYALRETPEFSDDPERVTVTLKLQA